MLELPTNARVEKFEDKESLSLAACDHLIEYANACIDTRGRFCISLSGGSTPKRLYELLSARSLPWEKTFWYWGDERNVPHDHDDSNYRMVRNALLQHVGIPEANIFPVPIDTDDPAATSAAYNATLCDTLVAGGDAVPQFDLMLLGMGDDAHTASLFPETAALQETQRVFVENWVEKFAKYRYTLT
ncbi:MAG: 6-phosphogluconolactonase, partial [Planctomycetota bacterium]